MTRPSSPMPERAPRASVPDRWRTRWLVPAVIVGLGGVILAAEAIDGDLTSGLVWFAVLTALGGLHAFGGRFEAVRQARGEEDEREAMINTRAMAWRGRCSSSCSRAASSLPGERRDRRPALG
jgi:hypothetical protein